MALTQISTQGIKDGTITGSDLATNVDLVDNQKLRLGTGNDLEIYHSGTNSLIDNNTGDLYINSAGGIFIAPNNSEAGVYVRPNGAVELYHDNSKKFETTSAGGTLTGDFTVTGNIYGGNHITIQDSDGASDMLKIGASEDLRIYHYNNNSYIRQHTDLPLIIGGTSTGQSLYLQPKDGENSAIFKPNGAVELYHDNSKKFETTSAGIDVTGAITATADLTLDTGGSTGINLKRGGTLQADIEIGSASDELAIRARGSSGFINLATGSSATERMRIDSSGNVGIGTTSPVRHMHLNGSGSDTVQLHITNATTGTTGSDGVSFALGSDESLIINQRESNHIALKTADTERMRIDSSGNVGIGTTTISNQRLKVNGNVVVDNGTLRCSDGFSSDTDLILNADANNDSGNSIIFKESGTERMRINSSGNVGIGETSPANLLHVKVSDTGVSPHASAQIVLERSGTNYLQFLTANSGTSGILFGDEDDNDVAQIKYDHNVPALIVVTEGTERVRIGSAGNIVATGQIRAGSNTEAAPSLSFSGNSDAGFYTPTDNNIKVVIDGDTKYGFGLSNFFPEDDNSRDLGQASKRWDDVRATNGSIVTSDKNEKNTIVASDLGLDFVNKLTPVSYKFNNKTRTHYGLISQDIETVLGTISKSATDFAGFCKDTITEDADGNALDIPFDIYGLRYQEFLAPMIKAIQELSAKVTALETS